MKDFINNNLIYIFVMIFFCSCNFKIIKYPSLNLNNIKNYYIAKNTSILDDYDGLSEKRKKEMEYLSSKDMSFIFCNNNHCFYLIPDVELNINKEGYTFIIKIIVRH